MFVILLSLIVFHRVKQNWRNQAQQVVWLSDTARENQLYLKSIAVSTRLAIHAFWFLNSGTMDELDPIINLSQSTM